MSTLLPADGAVRLHHLGLLRAHGADAASFLHGQLTSDTASLAVGEARVAGFCSAKGRLQASFTVWRESNDELLLLCAADLLVATAKRLSMFVLRAKCRLSDASGERAVWGVAGPSAERLADGMAVGATRVVEGATLLRLPDAAGAVRLLRVAAPSDFTEPEAPVLPLAHWRWLEVQSGVPLITAATVDQFVPQMINLELVGGVDFRKGCYPGQEVVARSQYRGTLKRRMFLFDVAAVDVAPGAEVFHTGDPGQPAGRVVNAAPRPDGAGASALVEVKLAALDAGSLHLGTVDGPALRQAALPYDVPTEAGQPA